MQYKIPQNVGIEDKIVGPLTLRQLIILAVGFGISYVLFAILSKIYELNILEYIIIALPALIAAAVALIKIGDITLTKFIFMFLEFSIKPKKRLWDHRGIASIVSPELTEAKKEAPPEEEKDKLAEKAKKASNLRELTQVLDSGGFEHLEQIKQDDLDQTHDNNLVTQAYFGHKKGESPTKNMYWRTIESHKKRLDIFARLPITKLKKGTKETAIAREEIAKAKAEAIGAPPVEALRRSPDSSGESFGPVGAPMVTPMGTVKQKTTATTEAPPKAFGEAPIRKEVQTETGSTAPPIQQERPKAPSAAPQTAMRQQEPKPEASTFGGKKKKRKRRRNIPQPVRENNQVNTTNKSKPAEYIPKTEAWTQAASKKTEQRAAGPAKQGKSEEELKSGEFKFEELKKGEINIDLD